MLRKVIRFRIIVKAKVYVYELLKYTELNENTFMNDEKPPLAITLPMLYQHADYNDNSLAEAINAKMGKEVVTQTKIRRMSQGESKQPRDSSIAPVANFFGLTVAQIKDVEYVKRYIDGNLMSGNYDRLDAIVRTLPQESLDLLLRVAESEAAAYKLRDEPQEES